MVWHVTNDLDEYLGEAGEFLRADPVEHTVPLTVIETVKERGPTAYGAAPSFGWWRPVAGEVAGAFVHTAPHPVLMTAMPQQAARELAETFADRRASVPGVNAEELVARAFADAWQGRTNATGEVQMRQRLYRLARLQAPDPCPPGASRFATDGDLPLVLSWLEEFEVVAHAPGSANATLIAGRIGHGGIALWEVDGVPVSLAGRSQVVAGVARIAPVYTPRQHRGRGYGAAVTAAITQASLEAGAREAVLFTDLANPTSNSIYQRLGYRPVSDRLVISFTTDR